MKYVIPGDPIPLARARYSSATRHFYDIQRSQKELYAAILKTIHRNKNTHTGPIKLNITFFMGLPHTKSLRAKRLKEKFHTGRPDLSNLIKFLEDAAQGILFADDCIIAQISAVKIYDEEPRTEFTIEELNPFGTV